MTYDVVDTEREAIDKIAYIYRNYAVTQNVDEKCYIARDNTDKSISPRQARRRTAFSITYTCQRECFISPNSAKFSRSVIPKTR